MKPCSVPFCDRPLRRNGMCDFHSKRARLGKPITEPILKMRGVTQPERFWAKIDKRGPDDCWPWIKGKNRGGYGIMTNPVTSSILSHRVSYLLNIGPIPDGLCVLHKCDNPPCCNPAHLFLGTIKDNNDDKMAKGRHRVNRGTAIHNARFTEDQIREIRQRRTRGETLQSIADIFGVVNGTISQIELRKTWKHVA